MELLENHPPHLDQELELMLAGSKPLAMFYGEIPTSGIIGERIIPEKKFRPYVEAGTIKRFAHESPSPFPCSHPDYSEYPMVRKVYFTLPGEEWRAQFMMWHFTRIYNRQQITTFTVDSIIEGRLLGYTENEIATFVRNMNPNLCLSMLGLPDK